MRNTKKLSSFRRSRELIESIIADWNVEFPTRLRIAWGSLMPEATAHGMGALYDIQDGLLAYDVADGTMNYELSLRHMVDDRTAKMSRTQDLVDLTTSFEEPLVLPRHSAPSLFNVMHCCQEGIQIRCGRDLAETPSDPNVWVYGLTTTWILHPSTLFMFRWYFANLNMSHSLILGQLAKGTGDDYWNMYM